LTKRLDNSKFLLRNIPDLYNMQFQIRLGNSWPGEEDSQENML
jgi:hypothetical protein